MEGRESEIGERENWSWSERMRRKKKEKKKQMLCCVGLGLDSEDRWKVWVRVWAYGRWLVPTYAQHLCL